MKSDGDDALAETRPATPSPAGPVARGSAEVPGPSPADPTRTSQPDRPASLTLTNEPDPAVAPPAGGARPPMGQLRDHDRYDILGEHGRGGLGRVSRAHDRDLGRDIAIKELISRGALSEVRFLREALITARLEHPGIVPVYEAGRWADGTPFYAMKLVSGRPLRDLIAERRTVDERLALLHHVIAVADAIAYAHGKTIIHRDLKPANVIVGEFGETVVIDWGLAKELAAAEEPPDGGPFREHRDDGLTSAGTVLGTPAYMAPEQARGEPVDQRADVYAIGAMLWELCSLHKLPPGFSGQRRRILRRSGIDPDLITIIEKAIDPEPARRYPDAGALAADLKAFKAGARIAARRYSAWGTLTHWTRRHRGLALSIAAAVVLAGAGSALYIQNIAVERDRADAALAQVEATQARLSHEHAELTLQHAELLLATDPTATIDALARYGGTSTERADQLRAEATGRGIARLRAAPHGDSILWVQGLPNGNLLSLSTDGTIARTGPDAASTAIARGANARGGGFSYSIALHALAYICEPMNLCLLDVLHENAVALPPAIRDVRITGLDFSGDGKQLATISPDGLVRIIDLSVPAQPRVRFQISAPGGGGVLFIDDSAIAVSLADGLKLARTDGTVQTLTDPDGSFWAVSPTDHQLVLATRTGQVYLADTLRLHTSQRTTICRDAVIGIKVLPGTRIVAFGCRDGVIGTWNPEDGTIETRAHLDGHASLLEVSEDGSYILAAGDSGTLAVIDLHTRMSHSRKGHRFALTAIAPPTRDHPYFLSADIRGEVRSWLPPERHVRLAGDIHQKIFSAVYSEASRGVIAGIRSSKLALYSARSVELVEPHLADTPFLAVSRDARRLAAYGFGTSIELWSLPPLHRDQILETEHGNLSHVEFLEDDTLLASTKTGELFTWNRDGQHLLVRLDHPISTFAQVPRTRTILVGAEDGLWRIDSASHASLLAARKDKITRLVPSADGVSVHAGYANGDVLAVNTQTQQTSLVLHAQGAIRDIAVADQGKRIAIAANDDTLYLSNGLSNASSTGPHAPWITLAARPRKLVFTRDGLLIAACTDGRIWIHSSLSGAWRFISAGTADFTDSVLLEAERAALLFGTDGHLYEVDLEAVRQEFQTSITRRQDK